MGILHSLNIDMRVTAKEFMTLLRYSKSKFYNEVKAGKIRKPCKDGNITFWYESYVKECVESKKATLD